jgi:hypothetical protein
MNHISGERRELRRSDPLPVLRSTRTSSRNTNKKHANSNGSNTNSSTIGMGSTSGAMHRVQISSNGDVEEWAVLKDAFKVPPGLHRANLSSTEISLAFPLAFVGEGVVGDATRQPPLSAIAIGSAGTCVVWEANALKPRPVHAFLPLRSYGFRFVVQADFTLPSSREDLQEGDVFNQV